MKLYSTVYGAASAEQIIDKSRFIAYVSPVETKEEADENNIYLISALMDDYIKEFYKSIWMIKQVIED